MPILKPLTLLLLLMSSRALSMPVSKPSRPPPVQGASRKNKNRTYMDRNVRAKCPHRARAVPATSATSANVTSAIHKLLPMEKNLNGLSFDISISGTCSPQRTPDLSDRLLAVHTPEAASHLCRFHRTNPQARLGISQQCVQAPVQFSIHSLPVLKKNDRGKNGQGLVCTCSAPWVHNEPHGFGSPD